MSFYYLPPHYLPHLLVAFTCSNLVIMDGEIPHSETDDNSSSWFLVTATADDTAVLGPIASAGLSM
jgi:hypothetical protein